jgi:hypothetical protein
MKVYIAFPEYITAYRCSLPNSTISREKQLYRQAFPSKKYTRRREETTAYHGNAHRTYTGGVATPREQHFSNDSRNSHGL